MARAKLLPARAKAGSTMIEGKLVDGSSRFAAVDPTVHHVEGRLAERPFGALLAPFASAAEARAALKRAGAVLQ